MEVPFTVIFIFAVSLFKLTHEVHECGKPIGTEFRLIEDRVVAGYDIGYYRYPWYAALIRYKMVACGGALIGPKTVVSAAHCFREFLDLANKGLQKLENVYTVKMGVYNICTTETTSREYMIDKVFIHELYYTKKPYYDISLLILAAETNAYGPICLPPPNLVNRPPDGTVPGLGTLRYHGAMPCTVHEARLLIHNDTECFNVINSTGNNPFLIHNAFCAGYIQGGVDTCQGDSGGPLQSMNSNGDYILIGIVSFGFRCADPGLLGMYTDVSKYIDWIQEKSGIRPIIAQVSPANANNQGSQIINNSGHHKKLVHFGRPFRRPIKIIIYRNNRWNVMTKSWLHQPIIRNVTLN